MIVLLSPSKTLTEKPESKVSDYSIPDFLDKSSELIELLRNFSPGELGKLMNINPKLSELNIERYLKWKLPFNTSNSNRAILMFKGEVYNGLKASTLNEKNLRFSNEHVRILSGLYGILRPLDLMQPYRLEMGTKISSGNWNSLYDFWDDLLVKKLNDEIASHDEKVIVNLASNEYFQAVNSDKLKYRVVKCQFKEERNGKLQFITIFGKKARGLMTRFIIENEIDKADDIKTFDLDGYYFNPDNSTEDEWLFTR